MRIVLQAVAIRCIGTDRCIRPDDSQRKEKYVFCSLCPLIGKRISRDALPKYDINPLGNKAAGTHKPKKHKNITASAESQAKTVINSIRL